MKDGEGARAFSLVEVVVAMAVASFALLTIIALLPVGMTSNRISVQETQAAGILTLLEADLRNTHPLAVSGKSMLYQLPLPYMNSSGKVVFNTALLAQTLYTTGLSRLEVPIVTGTSPLFQASVIYTRLPVAGSLEPIEGHIIVNWPYLNTQNPADLTQPGKVSGFVEGYVTFSAP